MAEAKVEAFSRIFLDHEGLTLDIEGGENWDGGVSTCIRRVNSKIIGVTYQEYSDEEVRTEVGHSDTWLFLGGLAMNLGRDIIDDADAQNQELCDAAEILFGDDSPLEEEMFRNALYLHHIYIRPEYRRAGLSRRVVAGCLLFHDIAHIGGVLLYVNSQYELPKEDPFANGDRKEGDKKLARLYRSMGFKPLRAHKGYMYANGDTLLRKLHPGGSM